MMSKDDPYQIEVLGSSSIFKTPYCFRETISQKSFQFCFLSDK